MTAQALTNSQPPIEQHYAIDASADQNRLQPQPLLSILEESGHSLPVIPSASLEQENNHQPLSLHHFSLFNSDDTILYHQNVEKLQELKDARTHKESIYFWINIAQLVTVVTASLIGTFLGLAAAIPLMAVFTGLWICNLKIECQVAEIQHEYNTLEQSHQNVSRRYHQNQIGLQVVRETKTKLIDSSSVFPSASPQIAALDLPVNGCTIARAGLDCFNVYGTKRNEEGQAQLLSEQQKLEQFHQYAFGNS